MPSTNDIKWLKEYTVNLAKSFHDMNQKIQTPPKKPISKISVDSNFTFTSYA